MNFLADRGWKRSIATLFCFVLLILIGGGFLFVMGDLVVTQVEDLAQKAPEYLDESAKWVNDTFGTDVTTDDITKQIESYQSDLTNIAANVGGRVRPDNRLIPWILGACLDAYERQRTGKWSG